MSTQQTKDQLLASIAQKRQDVAETERARSESRQRGTAPDHKKTASQSSTSSRHESIPEEPTQGANNGTGRATPTAAVAATGRRFSTDARAAETARTRGAEPVSDDSDDEYQDANNKQGKGKEPERPSSQNPARYPIRQTNLSGEQSRTPPPAPTAESSNTFRENSALYGNLNAEHRLLLDELQEINGQDSYDALSAGIGKLKRDEYLLLPNGISLHRVRPEDVGKPVAHQSLNIRDWAAIYALNKAVAPNGSDAATFALLRLEAVKAGWVDGQREISYKPVPDDALRTLATDMAQLRDRAAAIKTAAFLVPLVAEHVFRTMGHHFISTDATSYAARYSDTFRSCLMPDIPNMLPPSVLYHTALHWVSPRRSRSVLMAQLGGTQVPDALKIRANAAPAGTAILTTTNAILEAMSAIGLEVLFARYGGFNIDQIRGVTAIVKNNPPKFHKAYFAYGVTAPTQQEKDLLDNAKASSEKFAPFAQAFIDVYMRDAALGRAKALKKHADGNPIMLRRATNLFRAISRAPVATVEDLFRTAIASATHDDD